MALRAIWVKGHRDQTLVRIKEDLGTLLAPELEVGAKGGTNFVFAQKLRCHRSNLSWLFVVLSDNRRQFEKRLVSLNFVKGALLTGVTYIGANRRRQVRSRWIHAKVQHRWITGQGIEVAVKEGWESLRRSAFAARRAILLQTSVHLAHGQCAPHQSLTRRCRPVQAVPPACPLVRGITHVSDIRRVACPEPSHDIVALFGNS